MSSFLKIFVQVMILYILYYIGVLIQEFFHLMVPGSIIGMLLLFTLLHFKPFQKEWVKDGSLFLVRYLPLLFIPATVGVMEYFTLFTSKNILTVIIVLVSTAMVMAFTAVISQKLTDRNEEKMDSKERKQSV